MPRCLTCSAAVPDGSRFCPSCGSALDESAAPPDGLLLPDAPTTPAVRMPAASAAAASRSSPPRSAARSESASRSWRGAPGAQFAPGDMVAGRYRVAGLVGRGGMGEIYRADDLKLDQSVALKFLPRELAGDPARLEALYREVRVARQVSHANVCRTYDIGEFEGRPFITMEYVDGEDLASLLRRIGRLPGERAVELARQICAGLAAAHERGVLHRDLKPSNVMLDGEGRVRITDFGLAGIAAEFGPADLRSGTPAYMAPEQLAGTEVSVKSDLYALGLVLYEMFTGKPAFRATTYAELVRLHREEAPQNPSTLLREMDPAVERVILRCLSKEPRDRPASALAVAAALPGGDPLAAALAAGETPSPELVAAAGEEGTIRPRTGWIALGLVLAALVLAPFLASRSIFQRVSMDKSPEVLAERARDITARLGYPEPPRDTAGGFGTNDELIRYAWHQAKIADQGGWLAADRPAAVYYWYRQSPRELIPRSPSGQVTTDDPADDLSGMVALSLDTKGRLIAFQAVPRQVEDSTATPAPAATGVTGDSAATPAGAAVPRPAVAEPDWALLFDAAQLDASRFSPVAPRWTPVHYADRRAAWSGNLDDAGRFPVRIEAAAWRGRPTYFEIVGAWSRPEREVPFHLQTSQRVSQLLNLLLVMVALGAASLTARRNLRTGRGDRRGAIRLAAYFACLVTIAWFLVGDHSRDLNVEWNLFGNAVGGGLFLGLVVWVLYLALEPLVRRLWPELIISWTRLLAGQVRDPMVARDILIGAACGATIGTVQLLQNHVSGWIGMAPVEPDRVALSPLLGLRHMGESLVSVQVVAAVNAIFFFYLPLGILLLVRRQWIAFGLSFMLLSLLAGTRGDNPLFAMAMAAMIVGALLFVVRRFGLLATAVAFFYLLLLNGAPLGSDLSAWSSGPTKFVFVVGALLAAASLRVALPRRPRGAAG